MLTRLSIHGRKVSGVDSKQLRQREGSPGWEGDSSTKSAQGALPISCQLPGPLLGCDDLQRRRNGLNANDGLVGVISSRHSQFQIPAHQKFRETYCSSKDVSCEQLPQGLAFCLSEELKCRLHIFQWIASSHALSQSLQVEVEPGAEDLVSECSQAVEQKGL